MYGIPNALMCVESVLFCAAFWYAFSSSEYAHKPNSRRLPLWKAVIDSLNPSDLIRGVARAVTLLLGAFGGRRDGDAVHASAPVTRSGRGRYRTLDGMESLAQPERSRSRTPLGGELGQYSPPRYEVASGHLSAGGVRQERSQSPAGDFRYDPARGRDMV